MANINFSDKKTRIFGSAILAVLIILLIILVVPTLGGEQTGLASVGAATKGGFFDIHMGAYQ
jgi:hypothetical protein